ncbi:hypothetical protein JW796_04730 [Candidatus Dojkabacteria bacterium]|nr:hypothetical protein [Candidatus Dojkabacteria bacterium]
MSPDNISGDTNVSAAQRNKTKREGEKASSEKPTRREELHIFRTALLSSVGTMLATGCCCVCASLSLYDLTDGSVKSESLRGLVVPEPTRTPTATRTPLPTATFNPTATLDSRPSYERQGFELDRDCLEHAIPFTRIITDLPEEEAEGLSEKILPFLPEAVKNDNITDTKTNEGTVTYVYSRALNGIIAFREVDGKDLNTYSTTLALLRYNKKTKDFELLNSLFKPQRNNQGGWEYQVPPEDLKNEAEDNPYDYFYVALQVFLNNGFDIKSEWKNDPQMVLGETIGIEPFKLEKPSRAGYPTKTPTPPESTTQEPKATQRPATQQPEPTQRPTDIPVPTSQPEPTQRPTDIPIPLSIAIEDFYFYKNIPYFRIEIDKIPQNFRPFFEGYKQKKGRISISQQSLWEIINSVS